MATATHHDLVSPRIEERLRRGELSERQVEAFGEFLDRVQNDLLRHRIITDNAYTRWFRDGRATDAELAHFVRQFSVFSNQFLVAALLRVINAPSLQQARAAKEILMNELGVIYRKGNAPTAPARQDVADDDEARDREGDPDLVSTEGTVDGGLFRFRAAHFEWLLAVGEALGLGFDDLGKRRNGRDYTLHFCDELQRLLRRRGRPDRRGSELRRRELGCGRFLAGARGRPAAHQVDPPPALKVAFFTWHNRVEAQHAGHTMEELEGVFFDPSFDESRFFQGAREVLEAIAGFWEGLEDDRVRGVV